MALVGKKSLTAVRTSSRDQRETKGARCCIAGAFFCHGVDLCAAGKSAPWDVAVAQRVADDGPARVSMLVDVNCVGWKIDAP